VKVDDAAMSALMNIGQFARRCRLPASTLRYYHERKLLEPAHIDPSTGYRYYSAAQLPTAALINELRRIGLAPETIGAIVRGEADLGRALHTQRQRIESEIRERTVSLGALDRLVERVARPAAYACTVSRSRARMVPAVRGEVRSHAAVADIRHLVVRLCADLRRAGVADPGRYGAMLPLDLAAERVPATVFARADAVAVPAVELPGIRYATTTHAGAGGFEPAYDALLDWINANALRPTGPVVEEYSVDAGGLSTRIRIGLAA
jgi:DNA-binding transcriptional MerR regulator